MTLPLDVITEDRRLLNEVESTSESLARLRWHWTIDVSNPHRVAHMEYARAVGVDHATINVYARGYAIFEDCERTLTITDAINRARMSAETYASAEAVAESRGLSVSTVRRHHQPEIRQVREQARERAEKHGSSVAEEAPAVAESLVHAEEAGRTYRARRAERLGMRYIEMERLISDSKRSLVRAVNLAHEIEWGDEERELLSHGVDQLQSLLHLMKLSFVDSIEVDWDAEMAKLSEEG